MRVLIIHAHPEPQSFCAAMCTIAEKTLVAQGHLVTKSDLYAQNFNPVASADDFGERRDGDYLVYSLEQRQGWKTGTIAPDIVREVRRVLESDLLILNFPVFWFSVPAIMKGWIDRVFLSGAFFGGRRVYDRAELLGKKALVVATLGGRPHMFGEGAIHGELEGMLRHLLQGTLGYCGFKVLKPFFGYHVPYLPLESRGEILKAYETYLGGLEEIPVLEMPSLANFDDTLAPLDR